MIRVYIVTAYRSYQQALGDFLVATGSMAVVGSAGHPADAMHELARLAPNVLLLDVVGTDGPAWAQEVGERCPEVHVIVLGIREAESEVVAWARAGVGGYVGIEACLEDLVAAIEGVVRGEAPCPPRATAFLLRRI